MSINKDLLPFFTQFFTHTREKGNELCHPVLLCQLRGSSSLDLFCVAERGRIQDEDDNRNNRIRIIITPSSGQTFQGGLKVISNTDNILPFIDSFSLSHEFSHQTLGKPPRIGRSGVDTLEQKAGSCASALLTVKKTSIGRVAATAAPLRGRGRRLGMSLSSRWR